MVGDIDIAFALLRAALADPATQDNSSLWLADPVSTQDWWRLFRLLQRNHVAALCGTALDTAAMPREVLMPWIAEQQKAEEWHRYQREVQQDIIDTMAQHGVETMVLKGTHTAQYYPVPETREFGDLDLYFFDKHDEADRVAREVLKAEVGNDAHHHSKYNYRGVTVESHYDFVNRHYPPSNRAYEALLKELVSTKQTLPTFEVLFLLRHMAGHFAAGRITLRDIMDWTLTCRALDNQVDWSLVEKSINDYGMEQFVEALNSIIEKRLGISLHLLYSESQSLVVSLSNKIEKDIVYGTVDDHAADGLGRLGWKLRRWHALAWKRQMVYNDSAFRLFLASLSSHATKPHSILHKQ